MSEKSGGEAKGEPKAIPLKWALRGVAVLGVAGIVYIIAQASINPQRETNLKSLATGEMAKFVTPVEAAPAPVNSFQDPTGAPKRIADFRGKVTVVNLWATWCAPCKIEMPTLAALAEHYKGRDDVAVVTISMDVDKAVPEARAFIADHPPLAYYADPKFQLPFEFPGKGAMPQTILLDRQGNVRAVLTGEADWASAEAKALVDALLAEG